MIINKHRINNIIAIISLSLIAVVCLPVSVLPSTTVSAVDNTSVVDKINITVPVSCTMSGTGMQSHNAEITNGTYNSAIGETTLKAFCNDNEGFAIYAIGYTDNLNGKNVLTNSTLGSTHDIPTGTAISGNDSQWAMKLSTITTPQPTYPIIIAGSSDDAEKEQGDPDYSTFQEVPDDYTLVAKRTSGTDIGTVAEGTSLKTTYQSYISKTQPAGTYTGQVKYTLIHPHDEPTPPSSMLLTGSEVNIKMKNLAAGTNNATVGTAAPLIKSIQMANSLPANFEVMEANIVSTPDSKYPIYIFFDNTNDAGIMYFYTENNTVVMNRDSSMLFMYLTALEDISGLANWDSSNVVYMNGLFLYTSLSSLHGLEDWDINSVIDLNSTFAFNLSLTDISAISDWDFSNVESMASLFNQDRSLVTIDVSNWDTGNVLWMTAMFQVGSSDQGNGQLSEIIGLENWDVSNVKSMGWMFYGAGQMTHYDIANWDVSKVESFNHMFTDNRKLESLDLSKWDVSSVKTMCNMFDDNYKLTTIGDVSHWNTSSLIDATGWLNNSREFVGDNGTLDLSGWDTSNLKSTNEMFSTTKLEVIDLTGWTFDSITNSSWPGAGSGIYSEYSTGMPIMFKNTTSLNTVYLSQSGLDSFNAAVNRGVNITDMWSGSAISTFTVK